MYTCIRQTLTHVKDFKKFWRQRGPFEFILTSADFPTILIAPEEWIFSNEQTTLIKELMQFHQRQMSFRKTNLQPASTKSFTPEDIIPWQISHFPEEWNRIDCPAFMPQGYLTKKVLKRAEFIANKSEEQEIQQKEILEDQIIENPKFIETAFFQIVSQHLKQMGYLLLSPNKHNNTDSLGKYLHEWEEDERDSGLLEST